MMHTCKAHGVDNKYHTSEYDLNIRERTGGSRVCSRGHHSFWYEWSLAKWCYCGRKLWNCFPAEEALLRFGVGPDGLCEWWADNGVCFVVPGEDW